LRIKEQATRLTHFFDDDDDDDNDDDVNCEKAFLTDSSEGLRYIFTSYTTL